MQLHCWLPDRPGLKGNSLNVSNKKSVPVAAGIRAPDSGGLGCAILRLAQTTIRPAPNRSTNNNAETAICFR